VWNGATQYFGETTISLMSDGIAIVVWLELFREKSDVVLLKITFYFKIAERNFEVEMELRPQVYFRPAPSH